jgi:hypothetical protein
LVLSWFKEIRAAQSCAFFVPKEALVPEESDQDRDNEQEIIEIHAVGVPERKALGEAAEACVPG